MLYYCAVCMCVRAHLHVAVHCWCGVPACECEDSQEQKKKISKMLNWAQYQADTANVSDEDKEQCRHLLDVYRAFKGSSAARAGFVRKFEATQRSKKFDWVKDYQLKKEESTAQVETVLGKYMTRSQPCLAFVRCVRV